MSGIRTYEAGLAWFDPLLDATTEARVQALIAQLQPGVVERDLQGSAPIDEARWLRDSGLTALTVDPAWPGIAATADRGTALLTRWRAALSILRRVARTDLSAAALLGYNYMHLLRVELVAQPALFEGLRTKFLAAPMLWGGANNPAGPGAEMTRVEGGYLLNGRKNFASVAQVADWLVVGENFVAADGTRQRLVFLLDARTSGVSHGDDWRGIGARRTASGSLHFDAAFVPDEQVFSRFVQGESPAQARDSLGSLAFQVMFINLLAGAAQGACETAVAYLRRRDGDVEERAYASHVREAIGHGVAAAQASALLADRANDALAGLVVQALDGTLDWPQRGAAADIIFQAKVTADVNAHAVTNRIFEAVGARGASLDVGLDRYWRDVRTFTLHDPLAVKAQEVGNRALTGRAAVPSSNS